MNVRWILGAAMVLSVCVAAAGCSDDDDDDNKGNTGGTAATGGSETGGSETGGAATGGAATGGAATGGAAGAAGSGGSLPDEVTCDPSSANPGVCENATDCEFIPDQRAREAAVDCGSQVCIGNPEAEREACVTECIQTELGMTEACSTCYAESVTCTFDNCLAQCVSDPESTVCQECQVDSGCISDLEACSGLEF